jgi:hypothetical protein
LEQLAAVAVLPGVALPDVGALVLPQATIPALMAAMTAAGIIRRIESTPHQDGKTSRRPVTICDWPA